MDDYISQIAAGNVDLVRYVVVTDAKGVVLHASPADLKGEVYDRQLQPGQSQRQPVTAIRDSGDEGERILEVRTLLEAIAGGAGTMAVGFSLEPVERQVEVVARQVVVIALVLMLFNSALTAVYVETLIRPILNLNQTMKRAGGGNLSVRAPIGRGDEVGELAEAFNRMMDELEESRDREKVQRVQLAHTEKMVAVGTLAAGVAHEVNNPLAGILASIENLRAHPDDEAMRERYLELIRDGLKRIERTVANLLNFSRQREMRPEPTSINHNLRHVVELVDYQMRKSGVELKWDLDEDEALVLADHFQMEQLFLNLVLNALQAMPEGGSLTLRTRVRHGRVFAEVADTGVGIPESIRDRIFDPFFTTREVGEGTGLGLAVTDSIVAAHGGVIELGSSVGKGTVFRIILDELKVREKEAG